MGRLQPTASVGDPLKLSEVNTQFNTSNQSLRAFLRNGTYVKSSDINAGSSGAVVPTSGTINLLDLLGKSEVYLSNQSIQSSCQSYPPATASASSTFFLNNSGIASWQKNNSGASPPTTTGTYSGQWLPSGLNPGDYEVSAVWTDGGSFRDDGLGPISVTTTLTGSNSTGTWLSLSSTQAWSLSAAGGGGGVVERFHTGTLAISIRNASDSVVLETASISLISTYNSLA